MQPRFRAVLYRGWYYAEWREGGVQRRKALRTKHRDIADQTLKSFAQQYEVVNRPSNITVEYVWDEYRATLKGKPSYATMGFEGRALVPFFGAMQSEQIEQRDCLIYADKRRREGRKDGTIRTELGRLRSGLKWAEKKGLIAKAPEIYRPPPSPPRDLRLSRDESAEFLAACRMPHVRLFVILSMTTGARMGAILGLTWDRVNFAGRLIDLADPERRKTKKGRAVVPMNRTAAAALSEARAGALTPFVIEWAGKPVKSIKKGLRAAGMRCGLTWVTAHVFRHSAASWMAEAGVQMFEIAQFLGHADSRTTERTYARLSPDFLRGAADALEIGMVHSLVKKEKIG